ncbi:pyridoxamine 5'-phosphate oxidase family protein [Anaerosalibacter massiliensis]|uniref:Pyridoxamine 5'-phosphate oxidase family protein n=1 Tax=Anaerosalibacter massiliensis TaxID=1347392 RepID=A0A9X2S713_9FIRM|nr:pyridoxamine 5'-phosphate oxidase family protein [Anaerosalibacter massiliensis]MCR2044267.1 pyridoxamine 5'-phosphate oxidase family protein [Anaerosalibacter massiliensis]
MPTKWLSEDKSLNLLSKSVYGRLATCGEDEQPYITPINFVLYNEKIYFHTGFKGRKLENIKDNSKVCLEVSSPGKIYSAPEARNFTMRFWSVLVFGKANIVHDDKFKLTVMNKLMEKHASEYKYPDLSIEDMNIVNVVEISIDEVTGKASVDPN